MRFEDTRRFSRALPRNVQRTMRGETAAAHSSGYMAASQGEPEEANPFRQSRLFDEWARGWREYHEEKKPAGDAG